MVFPSRAGVVVDERGTTVVIAFDPGLYPEDVALKAAYWLGEHCHVHIGRGQEGGLVAEIRTKDGCEGPELTAACGEFCNALIDFALRARIAEETKGTQEALLQRAFVQLLPRAAGG